MSAGNRMNETTRNRMKKTTRNASGLAVKVRLGCALQFMRLPHRRAGTCRPCVNLSEVEEQGRNKECDWLLLFDHLGGGGRVAWRVQARLLLSTSGLRQLVFSRPY
jgi:hypothetical protein